MEPNHQLRAAREATPSPQIPGVHMSRQELAEAVNAWCAEHLEKPGALDEHYIGRLEQGRVRAPRRDYRAGFRAVLHHSDVELGWLPPGHVSRAKAADLSLSNEWTDERAAALGEAVRAGADLPITADCAPRLVHEWLVVEPPQTVQRSAGRRVGEALAATVTRRVEQLRHLDDYVAGGDLHPAAERELRVTANLVREGSYSHAVGRQLLTAVGELCQLAGWATADAGQHRSAGRYYTAGISAAQAAGDRPLAGNLISTLAYHVANTGDPRDAVLLGQSALTGSQGAASATTRALFSERVAWAYAKTGDPRATERALGQVEDLYVQREPADDPEWVYWLTPDEIDVMAGRCWTELGEPDRAQPLLTRALDGYGEQYTRELALYTSWLAETYAQQGEVEAAAELAGRVLELSARTASARSDDRVQYLRHLLEPHHDSPSVRELEERYRALIR
jgi:tetratricopeptide (TPR) repeat protein